MSEIKQVFQADDGTTFNSKAEAQDYMRRPKVRAALMKVTAGNEELSDWLLEKKDELESVFGIGTVKRVTKAERNKLKKALDAVVEQHEGESKFAFLIDNADAVAKTFKWPNQKRLSGDEKTAAVKEALVGMVGDDNAEVAEWIAANTAEIEEAYEAGKPKREPSPAALEGLAKYRAKKEAEKAAEQAGE